MLLFYDDNMSPSRHLSLPLFPQRRFAAFESFHYFYSQLILITLSDLEIKSSRFYLIPDPLHLIHLQMKKHADWDGMKEHILQMKKHAEWDGMREHIQVDYLIDNRFNKTVVKSA